MGKVMRYEGGKTAVYTDANPAAPSTAPLTSPLTNLGVLKFHSDLFYPKIVSSHSGSFTIPSVGRNGTNSGHLVTIAHGLGAAPIALGDMTVSSNLKTYTYNLNGTVIVPDQSPGIVYGTGPITAQEEQVAYAPCFITTASDATNVYIDYAQYSGYNTGRRHGTAPYTYPSSTIAQSVTYNLHILDLLSTQTTAPAGEVGTPGMELTATRITMGQRKFDTDHKHIRSVTSATDKMISGETIVMVGAPTNANASTTAPSFYGSMQLLARNLSNDTYTYQPGGGSYGAGHASYPSPTETPVQFP